MDIAIDLNHLTEGERDAILNVLSRDDSLKKRDRERIQKLKTEIKQIRVRGAIKAGQDAEKTCARCREPFGWLFNKPALCPKCQHKICQRCQKSVNDNKWLCELCHKQMEFDAMSNTWFNSQFRRSKRNPKTEKVVSGAELIKSSIRRGGYDAPEGSGSSLPEADMMTAEGDTTDGQNIPATDTSVSGSSPRPHDDRMSRGSGSSEREDNIEEMFAAHAHKNNLLSPHSISRESLASYYSDAGEANYGKIPVSGDILFGLNYNYKISTMEISVKECRDLAPVDTKKNRSDPYVKTYLLPDKSKSGKRKTRVRKNSLNPTFNEVLKYQVTKSELQTRTLWITVWNNDVLGRNDFLGEVTISLEYYHFTSSEPKWYKLQERLQVSSCTTLTYKGEIQLSLKYITPENVQFVKGKSKKVPNKGELHALISGCQNLTAVRSNGSSNPFCKGYLLPDKSSKVKTPVIKHTCNPTWKHTFMFDGVSAEDLGQFCLELTVWDHDRLTSNDFLGGVRIGLGSGFSKDKEVDWMDSEGREIELWQNMMDRPNFWVEGTLPLRSNMTPVKK